MTTRRLRVGLERWAGRAFRPLAALAEQAAIVASSDDAYVGVSRQGVITSWNPAAERLFGFRRREAIGLPVARLFPDDGSDEEETARRSAWRGERSRPYDTQVRRGDGTPVDVAVVAAPIRRRGRVVSVVLGVRDITGRQSAERALRAGEARFRAVVETARNAFVALDADGRITDWNRRAEEVFGWTRDEVVGRLLADTIVPPADRAAFTTELRGFLATGQSRLVGATQERTARRRDAALLPVELSVWHLEEDGRHTFNAFIQDISGRKRIEELQNQVAAIVEASDEAIVGLDSNLTVTHWNAGAEQLYGYPAAEALGRPIELLVPDGRPASLLESVIRGERVSGVETLVRDKAGRLVPISLSASPIRDAAGTIVGVSSVAHDITERREFRAALAAARDEALEASRLKSQFLATMSHEIRTPMNGVIGLTGLLLDTGLAPLQRRYAEAIRRAGEALLAVINDILDFSKIEAGKLELEAVDFDLAPLVEEVAELVAETAREKGVEIIAGCEPDAAVRFRGDANRLRQVLLNLVGNAVKFTPQGEVVIRARLDGEDDGRAVVRFDVSDTGIGIGPDLRARLFQPFSQADASTTRRFGGTGLGLAISGQLVEAMGGSIGVDSREGEGSTFWFTVPLERRPGVERRPFAHLLQAVPVLVVDDNETNRLILGAQLRSWGLRPRAVDGGPAALRALAEAAAAGAAFRAVVVDHQMPDMDGIELARRISTGPGGAGTPIVLLTSGGEIDTATAEAAGIAARLTKPVRQSDLYDLLLHLVAGLDDQTDAGDAVTSGAGAGTPRRGRVLVAEDNEINQMVAVGILAKLGYQADIAADGAAAVEAASAGGYAAILMDCHMPGVDGYEATARIRARERQSGGRVPIIAMTAGVLVEDRERALAAGMDDYVAKPVDVDLLDAVLERWAQDRPAEAPEARQVLPAESRPEGAPAGERPALDPERLAMLRRLGPEDGWGLLPRLAGSFLTEAPAIGSALGDLLCAGEGPALREAAHRLKGTAASIGATALAELCAALEEDAASDSLSDAHPVLEELTVELGRVCRALRALVPAS